MNHETFNWPCQVNESKLCRTQKADPFPEVREGVLLDYAIRAYVREAYLIVNGHEDCLRPANYDLRIGSPCYSKGDFRVLDEEQPDVIIDPHEVVVLKMHEQLNLPRYLVGRWNIRVKLTYLGLLLVSGPQVDPGFRGNLYCTVFNFSTTRVRLGYMERFSTIEFAKTVPACLPPEYAGLDDDQGLKDFATRYRRTKPPESGRELKDYLPPYVLKSAPAEFTRKVDDLRDRFDRFQLTIITVFAVLFAVLAALIGVAVAG